VLIGSFQEGKISECICSELLYLTEAYPNFFKILCWVCESGWC